LDVSCVSFDFNQLPKALYYARGRRGLPVV
jgi:hypothetical protein